MIYNIRKLRYCGRDLGKHSNCWTLNLRRDLIPVYGINLLPCFQAARIKSLISRENSVFSLHGELYKHSGVDSALCLSAAVVLWFREVSLIEVASALKILLGP